MTHHLGMASDPDLPATEFILEARIRALSLAAFLVALLLRRAKLDFLAPARVVSNERHMPQTAAVIPNLRAAIGRIHQVIAVGHPPLSHQRQGDRCLAVMHPGAGEQRAHHDTAVHRVQVQLVVVPFDLVALRVALAATITCLGQRGQHLGQALPQLLRNHLELGLAYFVLTRAATPRWPGYSNSFGSTPPVNVIVSFPSTFRTCCHVVYTTSPERALMTDEAKKTFISYYSQNISYLLKNGFYII